MEIDQKEVREIINKTVKILESKDFQELTAIYPQSKKITVFDFLSSLPEVVLIEYNELFPLFKEIKSLFIKYKKEKYNVKLNKYSKLVFNPSAITNNSKETNQSIEKLMGVVDEFLGKCNVKIPKISINIDEKTLIPNTNGSEIFVKYENLKKTSSYIVHEIGHIIELNDIHLYNECKCFLNSKDVFINEYIKTTYENGTEVFSTGLQLIFYSPIEFLFKDPFHFDLIYNYIRKNKHE